MEILLHDFFFKCPVSILYTFVQKCLYLESHTYCMTICQPIVVFVIAGSGDMIMFYSTIQAHIHCLSFAILVLIFRLLVTRWHTFMWLNWKYLQPNTRLHYFKDYFWGYYRKKGMWNSTTINVDPHTPNTSFKANELWHSKTCHICYFDELAWFDHLLKVKGHKSVSSSGF